MTEFATKPAGTPCAPSVHHLYTANARLRAALRNGRDTVAVSLTLCCLGAAAQAGSAWETFEARCLDPFESFTPPIIDGLAELADAKPLGAPTDTARAFGPTPEGHFVVIDAAPEEGEQSCWVVDTARDADRSGFDAWYAKQISTERYEETPAEELDEGVLEVLSGEWIEPRIRMRAYFESVVGAGVIYEMVETYLET